MRKLTGTKLVILNAGATYVRMFLCAGLALFSSRWILAALGEVDFGLYAVIAGVMSFLSFLTGAMAGSAQRHFAFSIGQGDLEEVNKWFNASLALHFCLAVLLVIIGLPFGRYMIDHVLTIPVERLAVCHKVFWCTLVTFVFRVLIVPYTGMFTAKQRIFELSLYQIIQVMFMFCFAYFLLMMKGDRLLIYAIGVAVFSLLVASIETLRCSLCFSECKLKFGFQSRLTYCKELISFGGWSLFGSLGAVASNQIMAFIINVFCGPRINASFGIANQVSAQANGVSQGLFNALAPEITTSEGRGDRERALMLSLLASKFSTLVMCLIFIPLIFELDTILALWLKNVPDYTASLALFVIVAQLILQLTIGYTIMVKAHGKIAGYQASLGSVVLCAPVMTWIMLKNGHTVVLSVGLALIAVRVINTFLRLLWVKHLFGVPASRWLKDVLLRCGLSVILPSLIAIAIDLTFEPTLWRLLAIFVLSPSALIVSSWFVGLNKAEQAYIVRFLRSAMRKVGLIKGV